MLYHKVTKITVMFIWCVYYKTVELYRDFPVMAPQGNIEVSTLIAPFSPLTEYFYHITSSVMLQAKPGMATHIIQYMLSL
uniref:Uncharacterized protein n=1 Tax=Pyxicephalus adspersus TaxID=30357 RepID=A0AAV3ALK0_PYXAD|nr:TPA: hypothetical protein GDO54_012406 [Pyxicephalus adspersus]